MTAGYRPVVLCVLDGWGLAPDSPANAATRADTPRLDAILRDYPHAKLEASGVAVGLPAGVMGNSEVGHLTMGAGYAEPQALELIDRSIADGSFFANPALRAATATARGGHTLHLMGLLSTGGVHADMRHLAALIDLAKRETARDVVVHAFLDGRDMPPRSAMPLIGQVGAPVATVHGRFYAMDRDKRWERTARSYRAIVDADGPTVPTAEDALTECYRSADCKDELLEPHIVGAGRPIADGDAVICFNFRPDRARQLTWALLQRDFDGFRRSRVPRDLTYVTLTDYQVELPDVQVAFPPATVIPIAEVLAERGLRQLHIAETEKYAHVTYFFNGGREEPFPGEDRVLVPSPKVRTYDEAPEMSAAPVAARLAEAIRSGIYDFAIANFANPDMVGHTGVFDAALRAMAATDAAVGTVVDAALAAGGCVLLTADHGNVEEMQFPDGGINTQHSTNAVPVAFVSRDPEHWTIRDGELKDVAPTLLGLLGIPVPDRMTGRTLLGEAMTRPVARGAWLVYAAIAGIMALLALFKWGGALVIAGPVLYGEGAVAHAAILTRTLATYADPGGSAFTAANYPPLYFLLASPGDPFVTGRVLSVIATVGIACLVAWRAWPGGKLVAVALGLGWLALSPVAIWGPAVKPDLVALALTVGAVLALERRRAGLASALLVLAVLAKPTALVPALALLGWVVWRERALLRRFALAGGIALVASAMALLPFGYADLWRHVVAWNALSWSLESALLLAFLGVIVLAALLGAALISRGFTGPIAAYAVAALVIVGLGGREGATINYLLDLAAAGSLALAAAAPLLARAPLYPIVAIANLAIAALILDPLGIIPGRSATTGAWGDPSRITAAEVVLASDELALAEDSGLLIATGHHVVVDDLFLWSRLVDRGSIDPSALLMDVGAGRFTAIVSEVELGQLATAPAYERARWAPALAQVIDERYRLVTRSPGGLFIYRPR